MTMKEIICENNKCEHNELNHCVLYANFVRLNKDGKCLSYQESYDYSERITATNETETKADLKDAEKVASKRD